VTHTVSLPSGATAIGPTTTRGSCAVAGAGVTCQIGSLPAGQSATVSVAFVPTAAGTPTLTANVTPTEGDPSGANNRATARLIVRPAACAPNRPPVRIETSRTGDGRLLVTVRAGVGTLHVLRFGSATNAAVSVGTTAGARGNFSYAVPGDAATTSFYVQRVAPNQAVTVPLVVEDDCGAWETFVGGGPSAF